MLTITMEIILVILIINNNVDHDEAGDMAWHKPFV